MNPRNLRVMTNGSANGKSGIRNRRAFKRGEVHGVYVYGMGNWNWSGFRELWDGPCVMTGCQIYIGMMDRNKRGIRIVFQKEADDKNKIRLKKRKKRIVLEAVS